MMIANTFKEVNCMQQDKLSDKFLIVLGKCVAIHGRWVVLSCIALVLIIIGTGSYNIAQHKLNAAKSPKMVQASQIKEQVVNKADAIKQADSIQGMRDEEVLVYNTMHKMINTKIVAIDGKIWGEIEITPDKCNQLISEITKSKYPDKGTLIIFLTNWKNNNFRNAVTEHNYLWDELGGTIGKANDIRS